MMQMLQAGGIPILSDEIRQPDEDNPHGYLEWEPVKLLRTNQECMRCCIGKAVKVIHLLLPDLPSSHEYRVIFMRRELTEILESQQAMLERSGKGGSKIGREELAKAYNRQIERVQSWLSSAANFRVLEVEYSDIISDAEPIILKIQNFLECELDRAAMRKSVDPRLYRNRAK